MEIIMDTNYILCCLKQRVPLFEEIEDLFPNVKIIMPSKVIDELEKIKKGGSNFKEKNYANIAIQLIKKKNVRLLESIDGVDNAIVDYALKNREVVVASLDKELRRKLEGKNKILTIKEKKRVWLVQ